MANPWANLGTNAHISCSLCRGLDVGSIWRMGNTLSVIGCNRRILGRRWLAVGDDGRWVGLCQQNKIICNYPTCGRRHKLVLLVRSDR